MSQLKHYKELLRKETLAQGFEAKLHEILEKERCELEEQARELVTQNIQ
jgi:hypothetical protein